MTNLKKSRSGARSGATFFTRLRDLGESQAQVDYDDLDDHLDDFGRGGGDEWAPRSATPSQRRASWAQFDGKRFSYAPASACHLYCTTPGGGKHIVK